MVLINHKDMIKKKYINIYEFLLYIFNKNIIVFIYNSNENIDFTISTSMNIIY